MAASTSAAAQAMSHRERVREVISSSGQALTVREVLQALSVAGRTEARQIRSAVYLMARSGILIEHAERTPRAFSTGRRVGRPPRAPETPMARASRLERHRLANIAYRQRQAAKAGRCASSVQPKQPHAAQTVEQWIAAGNEIERLPSRLLSRQSGRVDGPDHPRDLPLSGFS